MKRGEILALTEHGGRVLYLGRGVHRALRQKLDTPAGSRRGSSPRVASGEHFLEVDAGPDASHPARSVRQHLRHENEAPHRSAVEGVGARPRRGAIRTVDRVVRAQMVSNSNGGAASAGGTPPPADGWRLFAPEYEPTAGAGAELAQLLGNGEDEDRLAALDDEIAKTQQRDPIPKRYLTVLVLLRDLLQIGWRARVLGEQIWVRPHEGDGLPSKIAVRQQLLHGRDDQLGESTVRRFIESMDRPSNAGRSRSIANLIMDGRELADRLRPIAALPRADRDAALREVCRPYIQVATPDTRDKFTGHRLFHVWRYFRYTWTNRHRRPPGRNMAFLIRDAAQPNHPVMAIAALSSAVLQLSPRDDWAGWTVQGLARLLDDGSLRDSEILEALRRRVREDLAAIYTADLGFDGANPPTFDEALQVRLAGIMEEAQAERRKSLTLDPLERKFTLDASTLHRRALSPLFRAKRAATARSLLRVHQALAEIVGPLREALLAPSTRDAVALALRQVKQHFASASVLDLTTCGAVPPYGPLLGGKLACLMMLTPFVREAVRVAYAPVSLPSAPE